MPDNKINERLSRIRAIDQLFSSQPGTTFSSDEIIACVNAKNAEWKYDRYKLKRDIKFLEHDRCLRLKSELCRPSSGKGRSITKYGYQDSDASVFHYFLSDEDKLLIKDILDLLQLKGIESLTSFIKFDRKYGTIVSKNYSPIISFTKNPHEKKKVYRNLSRDIREIAK